MNKVIEKNSLTHKENISLKYGVLAGLAMSFYLLLFQISGNDYSPGYKSFMYFFLFLASIASLYQLSRAKKGPIFAKGIFTGLKLSIIASSFVAILNIILFLVHPDFAFSKFGLIPTSIYQAIIVSAMLFIEIFVMGNILAFVNMQYFKRSIPR